MEQKTGKNNESHTDRDSIKKKIEESRGGLFGSEPESSNTVNTDFMREKIKQRPINRKKLARRMIITACMAVLFGVVACLSFLILEPVINNMLYPQEEAEPVTFPEETQAEEMAPEDMIASDSEIAGTAETSAAVDADQIEREIRQIMAQNPAGISDYQKMYTELKKVAQQAERSVVVVTAITSDYDWFNDSYESTGKATGLIVADNGAQLLIAVQAQELAEAEEIQVTFNDGSQAQAQIKAQDTISGLAVIAVEAEELTEQMRENFDVATLGSSSARDLTGMPVIAVGAPSGSIYSVNYGIVTSAVGTLDVTDANYKLIVTDMYGGASASGVLVNLNGQVLGLIDMKYNSADTPNLLSAVGITELKDLIEALSNGQTKPYLGIHGTDVTETVHEEMGVPVGAYVTQIEMDSPAMLAGIQSGDVITGFDGLEIQSYEDLIEALYGSRAGRTVHLTIQRTGPDEYTEMDVSVVLGEG